MEHPTYAVIDIVAIALAAALAAALAGAAVLIGLYLMLELADLPPALSGR